MASSAGGEESSVPDTATPAVWDVASLAVGERIGKKKLLRVSGLVAQVCQATEQHQGARSGRFLLF